MILEKLQSIGCHLRYCNGKAKQQFVYPYIKQSFSGESLCKLQVHRLQKHKVSYNESFPEKKKNFKYTDEEFQLITWRVRKLKEKKAKSINTTLGKKVPNWTEVLFRQYKNRHDIRTSKEQ